MGEIKHTPNKVVENLEKREKKESDLRAAIARIKAQSNASRNRPQVVEPAIGDKPPAKKPRRK